ncbi:MAG: hypothetical protein MO853_03955 [Candidatus Protistobacter heckmanni]|nr:hypothetical protein [Candidatus Protistobacter heckmanni]
MACAREELGTLRRQGEHFEVAGRRQAADQGNGEVELVFFQLLQQALPAFDFHLDRQPRMLARLAHQHRREESGGRKHAHAQHDVAAVLAADELGLVAQGAGLGEQALGLEQDHAAGVGGADGVGAAVEQFEAEGFLPRLDAAGQGGLGEIEPAREKVFSSSRAAKCSRRRMLIMEEVSPGYAFYLSILPILIRQEEVFMRRI